jgi:cytochrome c peroxidase
MKNRSMGVANAAGMRGASRFSRFGCRPDRHDMPASAALVALGQRLCGDQTLSTDGKVACRGGTMSALSRPYIFHDTRRT